MKKIEGIIWLRSVVDKLIFKHNVRTYEVEEILSNKPLFKFIQKGKRKDENIYLVPCE